MGNYVAGTESEQVPETEHAGHHAGNGIDIATGHHPGNGHDMGNGHVMDRFPTDDELFAMRKRSGLPVRPEFDPDEIGLRFERHLIGPQFADAAKVISSRPLRELNDRMFLVKPWLVRLIIALGNRRVDHRTLTPEQRALFNAALQAAHADGSYQALAAVHNQNHRMHSMMGPVGTQRFLPWHRVYLLQVTRLLNQKRPGVTVPYWDYANDAARPDWVWQPPGVARNTPGANGGALPSQHTIDGLINTPAGSSYSAFTAGVESNAHNQVHNWCNGTISSPGTASQDPIFWLLHANVDRIWDKWQINHSGTPTLAASDTTMDPWSQTAAEVDDVLDLGYMYS